MVVMTSLATGVGLGAVSAFTIAFAVLQIPMGVIGIPLGIVIFPSLSRELAVGRTGSYLELVARSIRILLFVMLPSRRSAWRWRPGHRPAPRLRPVRRRGRPADRGHAVPLPHRPAGARDDWRARASLLRPAGHADAGRRRDPCRRDQHQPRRRARRPLGLPALGLAIAVGAWAEAILLLVVLRRREPALDVRGILSVGLRALIGAAVAAGVVASRWPCWRSASPRATRCRSSSSAPSPRSWAGSRTSASRSHCASRSFLP